MHYSSKHYARALYETTRGLDTAKLQQVMKKFIQLLAQSGDLSKADAIIESLRKQWNAHEGIQVLTLTMARDTEISGKAFGKNVIIQKRIDPSLIGGVKIQIDDTVWDGSVRRRLSVMSESLQ